MTHILYNLCGNEGVNLDQVLANKDLYYRTFSLRKPNGKFRPIDAPFGALIQAQKICLRYLTNGQFAIHEAAKAFRHGVSLKANAEPHRSQPKLLQIDLKDFFGSIKTHMIVPLLGTLVTDLVTYRGRLPQGAPTSPIVSNIYSYRLDCLMVEWASLNDLSYTRYADDMTFSGNYIPENYRQQLDAIVRSQALVINYKKTKLISNNYEQSVTGVTVNSDEVSISKRKCRHGLRSVLYYYGRHNMDLTESIRGMLAYIKSINENQYNKLIEDYERLKRSHRVNPR